MNVLDGMEEAATSKTVDCFVDGERGCFEPVGGVGGIAGGQFGLDQGA